jgi:hypothetical protein
MMIMMMMTVMIMMMTVMMMMTVTVVMKIWKSIAASSHTYYPGMETTMTMTMMMVIRFHRHQPH